MWRDKGSQYPIWNEVQIIDKEHHWKVRKFKEAEYINIAEKCINQTSVNLSIQQKKEQTLVKNMESPVL